jgi:uncharacterized membrane protein
MQTPAHRTQATTAGMLLGLGLGGFVDGIVLHQILQWHHMLSNWLPPHDHGRHAPQYGMGWDGLFHACVWLVTLLGVVLLWRAASQQETMPALGAFIGQLLFGWGLFNLVEGIIDHQILGVHYVRQVPNYTVYNFTFLAIGGVGLLLVGLLLMRTRRRDVIEL